MKLPHTDILHSKMVPVECDVQLATWKELSEMGMLVEVNKVLHQYGFAIGYDPLTGISYGAVVAPDEDPVFEYGEETMKRHEQRQKEYLGMFYDGWTPKEIIRHYRKKLEQK